MRGIYSGCPKAGRWPQWKAFHTKVTTEDLIHTITILKMIELQDEIYLERNLMERLGCYRCNQRKLLMYLNKGYKQYMQCSSQGLVQDIFTSFGNG